MEPMADSLLIDDVKVIEKEQVPLREIDSLNEAEVIEDMLATLTDDELIALAGQISAEISINSLIEE